jgi:hypothetical protein
MKHSNCLYILSKINVYHRKSLSWQAHISYLCHSLSKTYYIIRYLKNIPSNLGHHDFSFFQAVLYAAFSRMRAI